LCFYDLFSPGLTGRARTPPDAVHGKRQDGIPPPFCSLPESSPSSPVESSSSAFPQETIRLILEGGLFPPPTNLIAVFLSLPNTVSSSLQKKRYWRWADLPSPLAQRFIHTFLTRIGRSVSCIAHPELEVRRNICIWSFDLLFFTDIRVDVFIGSLTFC